MKSLAVLAFDWVVDGLSFTGLAVRCCVVAQVEPFIKPTTCVFFKRLGEVFSRLKFKREEINSTVPHFLCVSLFLFSVCSIVLKLTCVQPPPPLNRFFLGKEAAVHRLWKSMVLVISLFSSASRKYIRRHATRKHRQKFR